MSWCDFMCVICSICMFSCVVVHNYCCSVIALDVSTTTVVDLAIRSEVKRAQGAGQAAVSAHTDQHVHCACNVLYARRAWAIRPDFHVRDSMYVFTKTTPGITTGHLPVLDH